MTIFDILGKEYRAENPVYDRLGEKKFEKGTCFVLAGIDEDAMATIAKTVPGQPAGDDMFSRENTMFTEYDSIVGSVSTGRFLGKDGITLEDGGEAGTPLPEF